MYGLLLVLGSPLTCGLSWPPGVICAIVGIRRRAYPTAGWAGLVVGVIGLVVFAPLSLPTPAWAPDFIVRARANWTMREIGQAPLPSRASEIQFRNGGLFAQFVYLRFRLPRADARQFFTDQGATSIVPIGEGAGERKLVTIYEKGRLMEEAIRDRVEFDEGKYVTIISSTPAWLAWFSPEQIRRGMAYEHERGDATGICIYYDEIAEILFFYWHYS